MLCSAVGLGFCGGAEAEDGDTIYEYVVSEDTWDWVAWRTMVPTWEYPRHVERPKFAQLVIPTLDSTRYSNLLSLVYKVQKARPS